MLLQILLRPHPGHSLATISAVFYDTIADFTSIHLGYRRRRICRLSNYAAILVRLVNIFVQDFLRQPSEEEWARLSIYARRMRYLMDPRHERPSEAALKLLNTRFSGRCMLPNLRGVRWISAPPEHLEPMLPLIVSSTLTEFRLALNTHEPWDALQIVPALEALAPAYNSLVEIRFCHPTMHHPQIIHAASALLLKCNPEKLRYFHVNSVLSTEAFVHAAQFPNLEAFTIKFDTTEPGIPLPTSVFPSLRSLEIYATDTLPPLLQSINLIQSTTFTDLDLEFPAAAIGTFLPTTLAALRPGGLHQTLTRLSISPEGEFDLDEVTIRPLLFLNQLTMLDISMVCLRGRCPYKLSDENLEELVKAMPELRTLCFGLFPCSHPANNTIKSLVSVATYCKHLEELAIHTNVEVIVTGVFERGWDDPIPCDPLPTFVGCPLRNVMFGSCPIPGEQRGAMIFALALLRLFPHLISVTAFLGTLEKDPQWELVDGVIITDRRIRANIADASTSPSPFLSRNLLIRDDSR